MEHEESPELKQAKQTAWEIGNECLELLLENGSEKYFKQKFPNFNRAFVKEITAVVCIDEGCAHKDYNGQGKLTLAGAGILFPAQSEEERIKIVAKLFLEMGIKDVTSHEGCGAVKLAYQRDFPESKTNKEELENYGKDWVRKIIEEKKRMEYEATCNHIVLEEMERPAQFHNARVVYFDTIGGFNPNKEKDLPMGFVISRRHVPGDYALTELKVAVDIAFGGHGFGELFNDKNKFVIIPLAKDAGSLRAAETEIKNALAENENFSNIKIDGVIV